MNLKLLLKRGALLAAANWPVVLIQFAAETTFQVLVAVPIVGAAILVAVLLGADLANLLQGSMREMVTTIASALISEPLALVPYEHIANYEGRPSPACAYDDPGLFENRGNAVSPWRSDSRDRWPKAPTLATRNMRNKPENNGTFV